MVKVNLSTLAIRFCLGDGCLTQSLAQVQTKCFIMTQLFRLFYLYFFSSCLYVQHPYFIFSKKGLRSGNGTTMFQMQHKKPIIFILFCSVTVLTTLSNISQVMVDWTYLNSKHWNTVKACSLIVVRKYCMCNWIS